MAEVEKKPMKEKKAPSKKTAAAHPPYFEMIKEAIVALKEKGGSSPYAIAKYMEEKHKGVLPSNFRKILGLQLKNSAAKGKLTKVKASYKLSDSTKKDTTKKKPTTTAATKPNKKPTTAAAAKPTKKPTTAAKPTKKPAKTAKKAVTGTKRKAVEKKKVGTPVKKAKSIKSPAAKRARKTAV